MPAATACFDWRSGNTKQGLGTPLLTSHFVNLTMLTNARARSLDPGGTKLLPIVLIGRLLETRGRLLGQLRL